jgi:hypothetical protein
MIWHLKLKGRGVYFASCFHNCPKPQLEGEVERRTK